MCIYIHIKIYTDIHTYKHTRIYTCTVTALSHAPKSNASKLYESHEISRKLCAHESRTVYASQTTEEIFCTRVTNCK